jgi:hypothetical protein
MRGSSIRIIRCPHRVGRVVFATQVLHAAGLPGVIYSTPFLCAPAATGWTPQLSDVYSQAVRATELGIRADPRAIRAEMMRLCPQTRQLSLLAVTDRVLAARKRKAEACDRQGKRRR